MAVFSSKKSKILQQLALPEDQYEDASPKGSVDSGIRDLVDDINRQEDLVTTSSCAGRIAIYLEGRVNGNAADERANDSTTAPRKGSTGRSAGGKGNGRWLFVSHDLVVPASSEKGSLYEMLDLDATKQHLAPEVDGTRFCHFKFEPMIIHVLTRSNDAAQRVLSAALSAGFRESGISGIGNSASAASTPMIAVRTNGIALDSIIGYEDGHGHVVPMVSEAYLWTLLGVANKRFGINAERRDRLRASLIPCTSASDQDWEPTDIRKQRKREEGLKRQQALQAKTISGPSDNVDDLLDEKSFEILNQA